MYVMERCISLLTSLHFFPSISGALCESSQFCLAAQTIGISYDIKDQP